MKAKYYYMFIGNNIDEHDQIDKRFVIALEKDFELSYKCGSGFVCAANKDSVYKVGDSSALWSNPKSFDKRTPGLIRVSKEYVDKNFANVFAEFIDFDNAEYARLYNVNDGLAYIKRVKTVQLERMLNTLQTVSDFVTLSLAQSELIGFISSVLEERKSK